MKIKFLISLLIILCALTTYDIAPNPISVNGIYTKEPTKVRMLSEKVDVELYKESSIVECTFNMINYGEQTNLEVGFPVMNFHNWTLSGYQVDDKDNFTIEVDSFLLSHNDIRVPKEMDSIYKVFTATLESQKKYNKKVESVYKSNDVKKRKNGTLIYPNRTILKNVEKSVDSISKVFLTEDFGISGEILAEYAEKLTDGNNPWYIWDVTFDKGEKKTIKVTYELPSGLAYRAQYRYFKYILHTGAGWYKDIEKAEITLHLNDFPLKHTEEITPLGYTIDKSAKTIQWVFENLEPTKEDNIYFQYAIPREKRKYNRWKRQD